LSGEMTAESELWCSKCA